VSSWVSRSTALRFGECFLIGADATERLHIHLDVLSTFSERLDVVANHRVRQQVGSALTAGLFPAIQLRALLLQGTAADTLNEM
jgi:hypothetical protein